MIYASKERAMEVAAEQNALGWCCYKTIAVRTKHGWTIKLDSPYSPNAIEVLEVAP